MVCQIQVQIVEQNSVELHPLLIGHVLKTSLFSVVVEAYLGEMQSVFQDGMLHIAEELKHCTLGWIDGPKERTQNIMK